MKNKLRRDIFVIIFLLLVACIALAVPLAFSNPRWLLADRKSTRLNSSH